MTFPRTIRAPLTLLAAAAVLAPAALGAGTSQATSLDAGVLVQLNAIRAEHGLVPLTISPQLDQSAEAHSMQMISDGYFSHSSANGTPFWKRIELYYPSASYGYWSVGENLLWSYGPIDASVGIAAWMASPTHRANILDPSWRQIGIAAVDSPDAGGTFDGRPVTVITTDFGVRS